VRKAHPYQNYRNPRNKPLADLNEAVYLHLNGELEAVAARLKPSPRESADLRFHGF